MEFNNILNLGSAKNSDGSANWGDIGGNINNQTDLKTALNGKVDLDGSNATFPHITESYISSDGLSWYRKYSDGWVEQGGMIGGSYSNNANINFLVPFIDTKYIINFSNYSTEEGTIANKRNVCVNSYSTTGISFVSNPYVICWEAKGYYQ